MDLSDLHDDATIHLSAMQNVLLLHIKRPLSLEHIQALDTAMARLSRHNPQGVAIFAVMMIGAKAAEEALREAASQLLKGHERELIAVAMVLGAEEVHAATLRGIISAIAQAVGFKKISVFDNLTPAARWLGSQLAASGPMAPGSAELSEAMKACMGAHKPAS